MVVFAEIMVILTVMVVPIAIAVVFILYPVEPQQGEEFYYRPEYEYDTVPVSGPSWRPDPIWYLELTNVNSGLRVGKRFQRELTLGRFMGTGEQAHMLYLDENNTISKRQAKAVVYDAGVVLENLSTVNITRLNGKKLLSPDWIRYRDNLEIGDETYIVTAVSRVA